MCVMRWKDVRDREREPQATKGAYKTYVLSVLQDHQTIHRARGVAMKTPCYKCTEREVGCHSKCDRYIEFREKLDKENKARLEDKYAGAVFDRSPRSPKMFRGK